MYTQKVIQLPLSDHPLMTYTDEAALLSLLYTDRRTLPWVYSNLINICSFVAHPDYFMAFIFPNYGKTMLECCPECIDYSKIDRDLVSKSWGSVTNMLLDFIQLGYYTYFHCDRFYISQLGVNRHLMHQEFVSGYDIDKQIFYLSDFRRGKYVNISATFQEIEDAYTNFVLGGEWETYSIRFFKLRNEINYSIDKEMIILLFSDFLNSKNSFSLFKKFDYYYGLDVYISCIEFLNNKLANPGFTDTRFCSLLLKRAVLMLERLHYLTNEGKMGMLQKAIPLYEEIMNSLQVATNLIIMSNQLRDLNDLNRYKECLDRILVLFNKTFANEKLAAEIILDQLI